MQVSFILIAASIDEIKVSVVLAPVAERGGIGVNTHDKPLDSHANLKSATPIEPFRIIIQSIETSVISVRIVRCQQAPVAVDADVLEVFVDQPVLMPALHFEHRVA